MKVVVSLLAAFALVVSVPSIAGAKKKPLPRGIVESMQSVPCGVKQHGLAGLGSLWASAGVTHLNSDEKLCPQYLLRTDEMDYHIRPADLKHAVLLPVGHEGVFKIKKNILYLKIPDSDKKMRQYRVIAMEPVNSQSTGNTAYQPTSRPSEYRAPGNPATRQAMNQTGPPQK